MYQAVVKSSISEDNHYVDFEIDVVESPPSTDGYVIGLICLAVYGVILSTFAIFVAWGYLKKRSYSSCQKGTKFYLFVLDKVSSIFSNMHICVVFHLNLLQTSYFDQNA